MKNKKVIVVLLLFIIVICAFSFNLFSLNAKRGNSAYNVSFNEEKLSVADIAKKSNLILKCRILGVKESKVKTADTVSPEGEKFQVSAPTITYNLEAIESIKGKPMQKIELILLDSAQNDLIKVGEEYVMFLNKTNDITNDSYCLLSYSQGVNKVMTMDSKMLESMNIKESSIIIESVKTKEHIDLNALKEEVNKLENPTK